MAPRPPRTLPDHPRSRGVYAEAAPNEYVETGSSPLARGLRVRGRPERTVARIIPARAGFTRPCPYPSCHYRDHPRSRGVYRIVQSLMRHESGSSPLARGLPRMIAIHLRCCGIIPARAGFTSRPGSGAYAGRDHPRSRGVYSRTTTTHTAPPGSSPLARGLPRRDCR